MKTLADLIEQMILVKMDQTHTFCVQKCQEELRKKLSRIKREINEGVDFDG